MIIRKDPSGLPMYHIAEAEVKAEIPHRRGTSTWH
jgi:hypothetical protein